MTTHMLRRTRRTAAVVALAMLASLGTVLAAPAAAAAPAGSYRASIAPETVDAGASVWVEVTITRGSGVPMSEAAVTVPAALLPAGGLTADRVRLVAGPARWTATVDPSSTDIVLLRAGGPKLLRPGASLVVAIAVHARSQGSPHTLTTSAGGPSRSSLVPFTLDGPQPVLAVRQGLTTLEFVQPPTSARTGEVIAPAVTVIARDAAGAPVGGVDVVLGYGAHGAEQLPAGSTATTDGTGVATFGALAISPSGIGYTLVATSGSVRSAESGPFDIGDSVTVCGAGTPCDSGTVTSADGGTQLRVVADPGAAAALVVLFDGSDISCRQPSAVAVFNVPGRSTTITGTRSGTEAAGPHGTQVCFESTVPFPTADGGMATDGDGNGFPEGLLPDCASGATSSNVGFPCVAARAPVHSDHYHYHDDDDDGHGVVVTVLAPAGDPRMTW